MIRGRWREGKEAEKVREESKQCEGEFASVPLTLLGSRGAASLCDLKGWNMGL